MSATNKITIEVRLSDEDRALLAGAAVGKPKADEVEEVIDDNGDVGDTDDGGHDFGDAEPTKADVQTAMREYADATSKADAMKLMKAKGGAEALSTLKPEKYAAVIAACKKATKAK